MMKISHFALTLKVFVTYSLNQWLHQSLLMLFYRSFFKVIEKKGGEGIQTQNHCQTLKWMIRNVHSCWEEKEMVDFLFVLITVLVFTITSHKLGYLENGTFHYARSPNVNINNRKVLCSKMLKIYTLYKNKIESNELQCMYCVYNVQT